MSKPTFEWKATRATFHEMEKTLNDLAGGGWDLVNMFPPLSKDQGFTLVHKREPAPKEGTSRAMGWSE